MMSSPASQRNRLIELRGWPQDIANLVERPTEPMGGPELLEAAHRPGAPFEASVILFQHIIFVLVSPMFHTFPEFFGNGCGVAGVAIGRDLLRLDLSDRLGGAEERLGRGKISSLAQINIDQIAVTVDGSVEITPLACNFDVRLIGMPAAADLTGPPLA